MGFLADSASHTISPGMLLILYLSDEMNTDTRLPEIHALLGEKMMMSFLEVFGGRTITVPPAKKVLSAFKAVSAYMRFAELVEINCEDDAAIQTGVELDMKPGEVKRAHAKIRVMLSRMEEALENVVKEDSQEG